MARIGLVAAQALVDEGATLKTRIDRDEAKLKPVKAGLREFFDQHQDTPKIIGTKSLPKLGIFKSIPKNAQTTEVVDDLAAFIGILHKHPEFVAILQDHVVIGAPKIRQAFEDAGQPNPFTELERTTPFRSASVEIRRLNKAEQKALESS